MRIVALVLVLLASACDPFGIPEPSLIGDGGVNPGNDSGGNPPEDSGSPPNDGAPLPDAPPGEEDEHLLLTEVRTNGQPTQFIEIYNPLSVPVALRDYYLTDEQTYFLLPRHERDGTELPVGNGDTIVRFPDSQLPAGQAIVVALFEDGFREQFPGVQPDFAMVPSKTDPVAAPMVTIALVSTPMDMNDNNEAIILFRWDGQSDLVTDIDIVMIGDNEVIPGAENGLPLKTDQSVDGPDPDARVSSYLPDAATMLPFKIRNGGSYQRIELEPGNETESGGNGIGGHDETTEDTRTTWIQSGNTTPTPGVVNLR
jgi:uncharacterized protein